MSTLDPSQTISMYFLLMLKTSWSCLPVTLVPVQTHWRGNHLDGWDDLWARWLLAFWTATLHHSSSKAPLELINAYLKLKFNTSLIKTQAVFITDTWDGGNAWQFSSMTNVGNTSVMFALSFKYPISYYTRSRQKNCNQSYQVWILYHFWIWKYVSIFVLT